MDFERYTEFSEVRIYKEPERMPEWARLEQMEKSISLRELWKLLIK